MARVHALDALRATYNVYIKTTGLAILMDEEKVRRLLCAGSWGILAMQTANVLVFIRA